MSLPISPVGLTPTPASVVGSPTTPAGIAPHGAKVQFSPSAVQANEFARALEVARTHAVTPDRAAVAHAQAHPESGLGGQVVSKVQAISEQLRAEQKHITNLVERATMSGDDSMMMKAQLALADHQSRVQIITRVTSKAASSMDQLTRLQ